MVSRLSAKDFFREMLTKCVDELDIDTRLINFENLELEVKTDSIAFTTTGGIKIKIRDPAIVKVAKLSDLEEKNGELYQKRREKLLELFGMEKVYRGLRTDWKKYEIQTADLPINEIEDRIGLLSSKIGEHLRNLKLHAGFAIYKALSNKMPYVLFEGCIENMTEREILGLLADQTTRLRPAVKIVRRGGEDILAPYSIGSLPYSSPSRELREK